jgi:hypothetical protein
MNLLQCLKLLFNYHERDFHVDFKVGPGRPIIEGGMFSLSAFLFLRAELARDISGLLSILELTPGSEDNLISRLSHFASYWQMMSSEAIRTIFQVQAKGEGNATS